MAKKNKKVKKNPMKRGAISDLEMLKAGATMPAAAPSELGATSPLGEMGANIPTSSSPMNRRSMVPRKSESPCSGPRNQSPM